MPAHSAEHLEVLGKNASARYRIGEAATLTEAVIAVVKTAGLLPEQVKRVVEFANTDAFLTQFRKEGSHKVVEFPGGPASPFAVLQSLNQPASAIEHNTSTHDYDHPPPEKHASAEALDTALRESFRFGEASHEYPYVDPLGEAYALQQKLAGVEAAMTGDLSMLETAFGDLVEQLYNNVKQAALEGTDLGDVLHVWSTAPGATTDHVKLAFAIIAPRLLKEQVFRCADAIGASLEKFAHNRLVNPEHPLVTDFGDFCEVVTKLAEIRSARQEISAGLGQLNYFLKHATDPGLIQQVYSATGKAGKVLGGGAQRAAQVLLGPASPHAATVGKAVHKTVEHLPTAAAVVGANEVRRNLKYNPMYQSAKNTALSVVPGTPQYQQREYELAANSGGFQMPMGY